MQLYWPDYFGKTRHLSCEQHGAYLQLLGTMWLAGGTLPSDPKNLARIAGLSTSKWIAIASPVLAFFQEHDGRLTQKRVTEDLEKSRDKSKKRAEAGAKGGAAKSNKINDDEQANAVALPKHLPEPEPYREKKDSNESSENDLFEVQQPIKPPKKFMMPVDWAPSPENIAYAVDHGFTPQEITSEGLSFRDYFIDKQERRPGWDRSWQRWVRTASERHGLRIVHPVGDAPSAKRIAREDNLARSLAGFDAVVAGRRAVHGGG